MDLVDRQQIINIFVRGQVLIIAIVFFAVILVLVAALFTQVGSFLGFSSRGRMAEQASALADAGVERAVFKLNETAGNYYGDLAELPLGETGTFFITVTDKGQFLKAIVATGYVPNSTNPKAQRTIKVDAVINSANIAFHYVTQVGAGGIDMKNSSTINGTVYSNGSITGSGSSTINGDAYAVGTISTPDPFVTGTKHACPTDCQPPSQMPSIDYDKWKKAACDDDPNYPTSCLTTTVCSPTCTISSDTSIGTSKYQGNLAITNNAVVTLNGPIWITGNFSMSQGGTTLKLNNSFGSIGTMIIVDGTVDLTQGGQLSPTNANPKGYILLVATNPTADPVMSISQSGATALFYALEGNVELSQSAHVVSLAAKKLTLSQSATLDYDTGLAGAQFTKGPGAAWVVKKGTYKFTSSP